MSPLSREEAVRRLIHAVLEQGLKFGLDAAGMGLMGPAWAVVRPMIERIVGDLPETIAKRYKSSQEAVDEAAVALQAREADIAVVADALERHGMTPARVQAMLDGVDRLSDDMVALLQAQARQGKAVDELLALTKGWAGETGARLVLRGERLEYVGYLRVPETFERGYDLAPDSQMNAPFAGRHAPRGFLLWNVVVANDGRQSATVSGMTVRVLRELPVPDDAETGSLAPALASFEDHVVLEPGATGYAIFKGKYFHYKPDEADAFRVSATFPSDRRLVQEVQLVIEWSDQRGTHATYSPPLFLASAPAAEVAALAAHARIKFGAG